MGANPDRPSTKTGAVARVAARPPAAAGAAAAAGGGAGGAAAEAADAAGHSTHGSRRALRCKVARGRRAAGPLGVARRESPGGRRRRRRQRRSWQHPSTPVALRTACRCFLLHARRAREGSEPKARNCESRPPGGPPASASAAAGCWCRSESGADWDGSAKCEREATPACLMFALVGALVLPGRDARRRLPSLCSDHLLACSNQVPPHVHLLDVLWRHRIFGICGSMRMLHLRHAG